MLCMKKLTIPDAGTVILGLQDEIRRSQDARYDHRLHAILLVAQGFSARQVAEMLGDSPRTVVYWVKNFLDEGLAGLTELDRPGRPPRLSERQLDVIECVLRKSPSECGLLEISGTERLSPHSSWRSGMSSWECASANASSANWAFVCENHGPRWQMQTLNCRLL